MPGFLQFITGVYLMIGLTWFNTFGNVAPLYMVYSSLSPVFGSCTAHTR
jgi:hypothetical protein